MKSRGSARGEKREGRKFKRIYFATELWLIIMTIAESWLANVS